MLVRYNGYESVFLNFVGAMEIIKGEKNLSEPTIITLVISNIHPLTNLKLARDGSKYNAILPLSGLGILIFQTEPDVGRNALTRKASIKPLSKSLLDIPQASAIARAIDGMLEKCRF